MILLHYKRISIKSLSDYTVLYNGKEKSLVFMSAYLQKQGRHLHYWLEHSRWRCDQRDFVRSLHWGISIA